MPLSALDKEQREGEDTGERERWMEEGEEREVCLGVYTMPYRNLVIAFQPPCI